MKAIIIDPALHSMGGHHFSAHQRIVKDLHSLGVGYQSLGSTRVDDQVVEALRVEPCFTDCIYSRAEWSYRGAARQASITSRELARALRWKWQKPDLLILPCCDQVLALAVAKYLKGFSKERIPHVVMWLLFPPDFQRPNDDGSIDPENEYKEAFAALRAVIEDSNKLAVYCETESLANVYGKLAGVSIGIAPGANLAEEYHPPKQLLSSSIRTICCTGHANAPKGYHLLPGAAAEVLKQRRDVRFKIHGTINYFDVEKDLGTFRALADMGPDVVVLDRVLSQREYIEWLTDADLLLLPYDPVVYRSRGSGVFTEASALGLPAIVTAGCSFAQSAFEDGRAVPIEQRDAAGIARAVFKGLDCLLDLSARAKEFARTNTYQVTSRQILESSLRAIRAHRPTKGSHQSILSERN